jgi:UDP-N-acetylmuramoyl-tripeptide--D-alanyl-D-alanine ligase
MAEPSFHAPERMQTLRFGFAADNDNYPTGMMAHNGGMTFTAVYLAEERAFTLPLPGRHNVSNALAALAVARHYGITEHNIEEGLKRLKLTGMRIEVIMTASGLTLLNDAYNASPTSMKAAIDVLQSMKTSGSRIAVLGDMLELGPEEDDFHREIGVYIDPALTDLVFTYGPLAARIAEAATGKFGPERVFAFTDKADLSSALNSKCSSRDIVLFKASRGMRLEEVLHSLDEHFKQT